MAQMELEFNTNLSDGTTITLPLYGTVNVTVDWGDPSPNNETFNTTGDKEHTYASEGTYTVKITGTLTQFGKSTAACANADKLIKVTSFGDIGLTSLRGAFYGTTNLEQVPTSLPATITDLTFTFRNTGKANITGLSSWNVSNVTLMYGVFHDAAAFNQDLSSWDVSSVTDMESMFYNAAAYNQNIGGWNVSSVTNMAKMFHGTDAFNGDIGGWERTGSSLANVTDMSYMFDEAPSFNQDIGGWNVSKVTNMSDMFHDAVAFNGDISNWERTTPTSSSLASVTNMNNMFRDAQAFNKPLDNWNVSNVTKMGYMFKGAHIFNQPLNNWDVSSVSAYPEMASMFQDAWAFNQPLNNWDVSDITNMSYMFSHALAFNSSLAWGEKVSKVTNMYRMFATASSFNQDISGWNVSSVTDMSYMFNNADAFNQDISGWERGGSSLANVTNMSNMFDRADVFNQPLNSWNVSKVENMSNMFVWTGDFDQDIGDWDVGSVTNMSYMFSNTYDFNQDIGDWDVSSVINMSSMFNGADVFDQNIGGWDVSSVTNATDMFNNVTLSTANYNSLLIGWDARELYDDVTFNGGNSKYSPGAAATAKANIESTDSWTITDGGVETSITWVGNTDSDWDDGTNWSGDAVPITTSNVVIPVVGTTYPVITTDGTASCNNLTIYSGATLTINSASGGTGSLIVDGSSMGNVTVERYLTQGKWHYISAPVNDTRVFNTFLSLTSGATNDQFYWWDEDGTDNGSTGIWFDILNSPTGISYTVNKFLPSQGYAINYAGTGSETISFVGVPYTDDKPITLTKTDASTNTGSNLVGNPFTSTIAATNGASTTSFLTTNSSILDDTYNAIYLWDEKADYEGNRDDYTTISNSETATYLAVGQAFMVVAKTDDASLQFNTNMRKHGGPTFYKNNVQDDVTRFYMSVENDEGLYNEILIAFIDGMTKGLDISYDAGKLKGNPNIALYTKLVEDNGTDFAHQALPLLEDEVVAVKTGLDVSTAGSYTFKIKELQNFEESISIKLEDKLTGSLIDLRQIEEYSFNINQSGQIRERFVLHFNNATGIEDHEQESENIRFYVYNHKLYIIDKELKNGTIQLFNMLGQPVMEKQFSEAANTFDLNLSKGYYIVRIISDKATVSGKIFVE